jgi:hypothetical protein
MVASSHLVISPVELGGNQKPEKENDKMKSNEKTGITRKRHA